MMRGRICLAALSVALLCMHICSGIAANSLVTWCPQMAAWTHSSRETKSSGRHAELALLDERSGDGDADADAGDEDEDEDGVQHDSTTGQLQTKMDTMKQDSSQMMTTRQTASKDDEDSASALSAKPTKSMPATNTASPTESPNSQDEPAGGHKAGQNNYLHDSGLFLQ